MATKHLRQQIREALATALGNLDTTGSNVFVSRPAEHRFGPAELPALKIDTVDGGDIEAESMGGVGRYLNRTLRIAVTAVTAELDGYQDTTDDILKEVEEALGADMNVNTLGGLVKFIRPDGEPEVELDGEGEYRVAHARQIFVAVYVTALNAPTVAK